MLAAMAMYIETTREKSNADATTLEEAAEELLNGLLCHYEPPDARTQQKMQEEAGGIKKSRSILKPSKALKRKGTRRRSVGQRVRWKDEQNKMKTPDMYDIGKGCQEALAECNDNSNLERETAMLAHLSSQREPRPISKRVRNQPPSRDLYGEDARNSIQTFSEDESADVMNNYSGNSDDPVDPISKYRVEEMSPKKEPAPVADDADSLFDDLGNVVQETPSYDNGAGQQTSQYGPPPSPLPRVEPPPRRQQTPYKHPRMSQMSGDRAPPSTLCGIMCDPQYLNCEVQDGDYEDERFERFTPPPPPPPPQEYYYEDPEYSGVSGSDTGSYSDRENEEDVTPRRSLRDRFKRKNKKKSSKLPPEEAESISSKSRGRSRSRSRSPGRIVGKLSRRSKSPGKSRKDRKFPRSPMSFITGNRSFSQSPRAKDESEANLSMQSMGSETTTSRQKTKSPGRKWFGRSKKADEEKGSETSPQVAPENEDWAPNPIRYPPPQGHPAFGQIAYGEAMPFQARGRSMERRSYDGLDSIDRSRLSDFVDPKEDEDALHPSRSRSLDRQDEGRRSRLSSYDRAESHIGLSRVSFDENENQEQSKVTRSRSLEKLDKWLRPLRGRSKERSEDDTQQLRPSRSRSLDRQEVDIRPSRSRSLERQDQRPQENGYVNHGYENGYAGHPIYAPHNLSAEDQRGLLVQTRSRSFDGQVDPRRASYPFAPQEPYLAYSRGYPAAGYYYDNRGFALTQNNLPQLSQQRPLPMMTREEYLDSQYSNFMAQRSPSYPPHTPSQNTFAKTNRRSFDYSDIREGISRMWGGVSKSPSAEQRKTAVEPPAAIYSYVEEPPQQLNSIYSHSATATPVQAIERRGMPPTPMQREQFEQAHHLHHYSANRRQMPPTPMQYGNPVYSQPNGNQYEQRNNPLPSQTQRDPTPRSQIADFIQSTFQQTPPTKPPSPPRQMARPYSVAEQIHRVSWGESRQGSHEESSSNQVNQATSAEPQPAATIPQTLPGKEKSRTQPPPPPPPPPPKEQQLQRRPPSTNPGEKPPRPATAALPPKEQSSQRPPYAGTVPETMPKVAAAEPKQSEFTDTVDENEPADQLGSKKEGKAGRKLLGIFNRNKKKKTLPSKGRQVESEENSGPEPDVGSIISDAILRDRYDRFVTQM